MTRQGHPYAIFQRTLRNGNAPAAWAAAAQLHAVSLADALALTLLVREKWPARYPRAAARWAGRYATETNATIDAVMLVASHLAARDIDLEPLAALLDAHGHSDLADAIRKRDRS